MDVTWSSAITDLELSFQEELLVFGASLDEVELACRLLVREIWEEIDFAMSALWKTDDERRAMASSCDIASLLEAEPVERDGVCRLLLDVESETAALSLSRSLTVPLVAITRFRESWVRMLLYEKCRNRGWVFWASPLWIEGFENEIEPALASAARASNGWIGEIAPFEHLLAPGYGGRNLRNLLEADVESASEFMQHLYALLGAPELI